MPDLTPALLPGLRSHRLSALDLGDEFVYPDYFGRSILNLPSSICTWLGVPELGAGPLHPDILAPLGDGYQNVILILMDALSLRRLTQLIAEGILPLWEKLADAGVLAPLTSITPSTTTAALTSLWTGTSAAEHGIVGYEMWFKEYGVVANTILHSPMSFQGDAGSLSKAGLDPETFLEPPLLGSHLSDNGVRVFAFQHQSIFRSSLSRMLLRDVNLNSFRTPADLWVNVRRTLQEHVQDRRYIWVYWGEVDNFAHHYGPDDERTVAEFVNFSTSLESLFLDRIDGSAVGKTLLLLMADHGQINTSPNPHYDLRNHPNLLRRLHIMPTGENRLAYLYLRPGQGEAVREYIERTWPGGFSFLDPVFAVEAGLFGPSPFHPRLYDRLGDLIVLARGDAYLWWSNKRDHLLGRHGGLSPDEMLVPFLGFSL
jgi:predicted AlkP superfamily pyrophosphatase or phosphodiesterase